VVAVSLGCFGASLANGSEYTGDYGVADLDHLVGFHFRRLELLLVEGLELLACETIPRLVEAQALAVVLSRVPNIPAWVTFCCRDIERVSCGELLVDCLLPLVGVRNVIGLGINCTDPTLISRLVPIVQRTIAPKLTVVYPNSGEVWENEKKEWSWKVSSTDSALAWVAELGELGVELVGGCCRVYPEQIAALKRTLVRPTQLHEGRSK